MANEALAEKLAKEAAEFFEKVDKKGAGGGPSDNIFARPDDEPLTKKEIAEIKQYWGKYSFAYPNIDDRSFQTFKNRCGRFDVRHCPGAVWQYYLSPFLSDEQYSVAYSNKALMEYMYPDFKKPRTLFRKMDGEYYDEFFKPTTMAGIVAGCRAHLLEKGGLLVRPAAGLGGKDARLLTRADAAEPIVQKALTRDMRMGAFVVQETLEQSPFMARLDSGSMNTVRVTTLFHKGRITPLAALLRIGGTLLGLDTESGRCYDWALARDGSRVSVLPGGVDLKAQELFVPNFVKIREQVTHGHGRIPYLKLLSWDMALDKDNEPVLIECSHNGEIQLHEAVTGPLFGDLLDELLDECLLKSFHIRFMEGDLLCREYSDRIEIEKCLGQNMAVAVPRKIRGKPVTIVTEEALKTADTPLVFMPPRTAADSFREIFRRARERRRLDR